MCKLGTSDGRVLIREFQGENEAELRYSLGEQGFYIFDVKRIWSFAGRVSGVIRNDVLLRLNQEFLVLFRAGLPVVRVLETLIRRTSDAKLRQVLGDVLIEVKGGASLSSAFAVVPGFFPYLYLAALKAGERSGDIPETLGRFYEYQSRMEAVKRKIRNAAFYPLFLFSITLLQVAGLLTYVVPRFAEIYADAGSQLPLLTRIILAVSEVLEYIAPLTVMFLVLIVPVARHLLRRGGWKYRLDKFLARLPLLGDILTEYALARFARTLATILSSGTPLVEGMRMARATLNNRFFETAMEKVIQRVEEGEKFTESLEDAEIFPVVAIGMLDAGETAGALDSTLFDVATFYDAEVEQHIERLTRWVEPVMFLVVGAIIAFVVVGMYLPIFHLGETTG